MNYGNQIHKVAVVGYNRIPFARRNTAYQVASNQDMMTAVLDGLIDRCHLKGELLGEVAGGAVIKDSRESDLMRESVMGTSLDPSTPACDLQQACATGIEAVVYIANKIALGQISVGIAGGCDSTSDVPLVLSENLRRTLLAADRSHTLLEKLKLFSSIGFKDLKPHGPGMEEPRTGLTMGDHTELTAKYYDIPRIEQDKLAFESHQKMTTAYESGFFEGMISPYLGLDHDNNVRKDTSMQKLARLKPSFDKVNGSLTAGNSTPFTDGASCVLLSNAEWARVHSLPIFAYISFAEVAAIEYVEQ